MIKSFIQPAPDALNIRYYLRQIFGNCAFVLRIQYFCNGTKNSLQSSYNFAVEPNYICLPSEIGQLLQLPTFSKKQVVNTLPPNQLHAPYIAMPAVNKHSCDSRVHFEPANFCFL